MTGPVLVDTSALYAVLDADDARHDEAARAWHALLDTVADGTGQAISHSGVSVEASALVQRRLGIDALRSLHTEILPVIDIVWVTRSLHDRAVVAMLAAGRRELSLVDWTSFELMRVEGIDTALAFDDGFAAQGFLDFRASA